MGESNDQNELLPPKGSPHLMTLWPYLWMMPFLENKTASLSHLQLGASNPIFVVEGLY